MPATSTKKAPGEAGTSKETSVAEVTPLRISSRVRKEKFNVKELFSNNRDILSDDEPKKITKKKISSTPVASTSKSQLEKEARTLATKSDNVKPSTSKHLGFIKTDSSTPKPGPSKVQIPSKSTLAKMNSDTSIPGTSKDSDSYKVTPPKTKSKNIQDDKFDPLKGETIKVEPIFNENNIESVLENPSSLGLDIVVTRVSESDKHESETSKKSKNVVTIAKVTGSSTASKPIKVVPMKPTDVTTETPEKLSESKATPKSLGFKGSGVVITPKMDKNSEKSSTIVLDKKGKVLQRPSSVNKVSSIKNIDVTPIKELKGSKSLGTDVVVVTQTIDTKGTISTKIIEKKREIKSDHKQKNKISPTIVEVDLDKSKYKEITSIDRVKEVQRQKAIKRSILDVMSDVKTNGHKYSRSKGKSAEGDTSSQESDYIKRVKFAEEMFGDETPDVEVQKTGYDFNKYFRTSESIIEHNESLDSDDSNEDQNDAYLSHFYEKDSLNNNNNKKSNFRQLDNSQDSDEYTIYDLMYEINCEHPSWNLHVMQDNASFLICQVTRGQHGLPTMNKMIELESDLSSAKVYVNQIFHREFCGSYNTYDSIRELITTVQQL